MDTVVALAECPHVDVNWQDSEGNTALITAAQAGKSLHSPSRTLLLGRVGSADSWMHPTDLEGDSPRACAGKGLTGMQEKVHIFLCALGTAHLPTESGRIQNGAATS